jgi:hypothetical protein
MSNPSSIPSADVRIYFSEFFEVSPKAIEDYGAFDVSCLIDLPLFIDRRTT